MTPVKNDTSDSSIVTANTEAHQYCTIIVYQESPFDLHRLCLVVHARQDSCLGLLLDGSLGLWTHLEIC